MSNKRFTDEQIDRFLSEVEDGLSISDRDAAGGPDEAVLPRRSRPERNHAFNGRRDKPAIARGFVAFAVFVLAALALSGFMHFYRANEVAAVDARVTALRQEVAASDDIGALHSRLEQLEARVQGLATRLDVIRDSTVGTGQLHRAISGQSASDRDAAGDPPLRPEQPAESNGGDYAINLVAVADPATAERIERHLSGLGMEPRVDIVELDRTALRRIVVPGYESYSEAKEAADRLKEQLGLSEDPWIARR